MFKMSNQIIGKKKMKTDQSTSSLALRCGKTRTLKILGGNLALGGNLLQPQIDYDFQTMSPNIAPVVVDAVHSSFGK